MSEFNAYAHEPEAVEITRAWIRRMSPLVALYGPSGSGKTTLVGSLFSHPLYRRVLVIDVDQGTATIDHLTGNEEICDFKPFDKTPDKRIGWLNQHIRYAQQAECGSIVIEGFTSILSGLVSRKMEQIDDPEGSEAMRVHIGPSNRMSALIESLRGIKQYRLANNCGVPIVVTLNTRLTPVSPGDMKDQRKKIVPDWSPNLTDKAKRTCDAFIEVTRGLTGSRLLTLETPDNTARKLRAPFDAENSKLPNAAALVQRQTDLDLPGMFALWASATKQFDNAFARDNAPTDPSNEQQSS